MDKMCNSCGEQPAVLTVSATNSESTLLDTMDICFDCTGEKIIELLPGCKDAKK